MAIYIIIAVVAILVLFIIGSYNGFVKSNNTVEEAFSTMDIYLKKRWDLIPNLVETVKGYVKHEKETLEEIVKLRNGSYDKMSESDKIDVNNKLTQSLGKIMAVAENYPDLKASDNFNELSKELAKVEEDIANARKYYNGAVREYNTKVRTIPNNIIAGLFGFKEKEMFKANSEERENVKIEF